MKKKLFGLELVFVVCLCMVLTPVAHAATPGDPHPPIGDYEYENPALPRVYTGETNVRPRYTELTRPSDSMPINSVIDNPDYGDEFYFLTITNVRTADTWRAGTAELIPGDQYLIEIYCRNDCKSNDSRMGYEELRMKIDMPYHLNAGEVQKFGAKIIADSTTSVATSIDVVSRKGISILYVDDSIRRTGEGGEHPNISYEELFTTGAKVSPWGLGVNHRMTVSFVIQVEEDRGSTMWINPDVNYAALISPSGTGFVNSPNSVVNTSKTAEPKDTNTQYDTFHTVWLVLSSVVALGGLGFAMGYNIGVDNAKKP